MARERAWRDQVFGSVSKSTPMNQVPIGRLAAPKIVPTVADA
jgi:hypothetical protein